MREERRELFEVVRETEEEGFWVGGFRVLWFVGLGKIDVTVSRLMIR